ncbi:MAG: 16S rRNA (guanine(527)-N(7))-methyltransferase RsmG [Bacilli bacterium]|jgi:16S rRNA (guanine527-N7)-methyltransferase
MNEKEFIEALKQLSITLNKKQQYQLSKYYEMLVEKNKVINLTNITEKESVYLKHFYDSLTLSMVCDFNKYESLCDIGTGAGFPGLVLKIVFPHLKVVLIDSLEKRITFLNEVISDLKLQDIEAIHIRAEEYAKSNREKYDIVTSRAVARLSVLSELCLPIVKVGGYFISMKAHAEEEIKEIDENLKKLNSEIELVKTFMLPIEESMRTFIVIKKTKITDKRYPREFKEIKRKPL